MLDQSFSASNFKVIFNRENRKGKVDISTMSSTYQAILEQLKKKKTNARDIARKKKKDRTPKKLCTLEKLEAELKELQEKKERELSREMSSVADEVNSRSFRFDIEKHLYADKEEFIIQDSKASFYAMKQLLQNMKRTFKIEMQGRHQILTTIKQLLNMSMPVFIIRTDISSFYESIPQQALLQKVFDNNLLSYKSKSFIKQIFSAYEDKKDTSMVKKGVGVPRGIGISAVLSELYMQDIDQEFKSRDGVILYERYVDDIFMVLTSLGAFENLRDYYNDMQRWFRNKGLELKEDDSDKCQLIKYSPANDFKRVSFDYLGYRLTLSKSGKGGLVTKFSLSDKKIKKIFERIDKAFKHFETLSKKDVGAARRDLFDSLNFITGNFRLSNSKRHVKAGLYYNNALVDDLSCFENFTEGLHKHAINPYSGLFVDIVERNKFVEALQKRIQKIDFKQRWESRKMYDFSLARISEISSWL